MFRPTEVDRRRGCDILPHPVPTCRKHFQLVTGKFTLTLIQGSLHLVNTLVILGQLPDARACPFHSIHLGSSRRWSPGQRCNLRPLPSNTTSRWQRITPCLDHVGAP